jgi:hypothetical protein
MGINRFDPGNVKQRNRHLHKHVSLVSKKYGNIHDRALYDGHFRPFDIVNCTIGDMDPKRLKRAPTKKSEYIIRTHGNLIVSKGA